MPMANSLELRWDGLAELRRMLRTIPATTQPEVTALVNYHARWAHGALLAAYPEVSGNLRKGVRLAQTMMHGVAAAVVTSRAPHAWIFEKGTRPRQTRRGVNRGSSPPHYTFRNTVTPQRYRLFDDLKQLLIRRGFEVYDDAA